MRIKIAGWTSEGLRCPDVTVDFCDASGKAAKIALVQMPNGTGKTTTLELLNATLSGDAVKWDETKVREFRRAREVNAKGRFIARLLVDDRRLTIELVFDFDAGKISYRTTNPGSGGIVPDWRPPPAVLQFLKPQFLKLFIFDGEFAERLFNPAEAEADGAIDALCQIYLLDDIARFSRDEWDRIARHAGGPKSEAALRRIKEERIELLQRKADVEAARDRAGLKLNEATITAAELEKSINERVTSVASTRSRFSQAQLDLANANADVARITDRVMQDVRMPLAVHAAFGAELIDLKANLDTLRLPENTSAQFFEDLVHEPECVCGREMTIGAQTEIRSRAKRYLDAAESGTINAMKQDITRFTETDEVAPDVRLTALLDELTEARRLSRSAEQSVRALQQKLIDEGDDQLKAWQDALKDQSKIIVDCKDILQKIDEEGDDAEIGQMLSLKAIEKRLQDIDRRVSELTSTVTLRRQTEVLSRILKRATALARTRIKKELVEECNAKLEAILVNDPLKLDRIDRSLRLADQVKASVGQTLAVSYTFLMSILNRGNNDFPLIVDSPANSIDEPVRRNIGRLIPQLCSQFVAFTINTERSAFVPALASGGDDIRYLTLFRKTERLMGGLPSEGVTQTDNAVLVDGAEYFKTFDVAKEEDA